jgi:hypothetical protein
LRFSSIAIFLHPTFWIMNYISPTPIISVALELNQKLLFPKIFESNAVLRISNNRIF